MNEPEVGGMRQEDYSKDWVMQILYENIDGNIVSSDVFDQMIMLLQDVESA